MKIALVTPYDYPYPGGVTEHIRHLDREFRARGHDTRLLAPSMQPQAALDANVIKVSSDVLPILFNGIDYARFAAPAIQPIAEFGDGRPNILFVGRLEPRKGSHHLLNAYPHIQCAIPEVRLLVDGAFGSEDQARLDEHIRANHLRDVHLIRHVSREELPRSYRTATRFCAPSTGG